MTRSMKPKRPLRKVNRIFDMNEETSELTMQGDICSYAPSITNMWIDPDATNQVDIKYNIIDIDLLHSSVQTI